MIYFANPTKNPECWQHMETGRIGAIAVRQGDYYDHFPNAIWCADNGCYSEKDFNIDRWFTRLRTPRLRMDRCAFATAPDVYANATATLDRSAPWLPRIRDLGYPAALVAQDGLTTDMLDWNSFDALFIGGTTIFKLGANTRALVAEARARNKWVHLGRCNSHKRYRYAAAIGCHSADGTRIVYAPTSALADILHWTSSHQCQPALFDLIGHP